MITGRHGRMLVSPVEVVKCARVGGVGGVRIKKFFMNYGGVHSVRKTTNFQWTQKHLSEASEPRFSDTPPSRGSNHLAMSVCAKPLFCQYT